MPRRRAASDLTRRAFLATAAGAALAPLVARGGPATGPGDAGVAPRLAARAATLLPSRWRDQVLDARATYLAVPADDWLKGFRRKAGLPAPGGGLGGWCGDTSGVIFGQVVGGLARLGRLLGDSACTARSVELFDGWRATLPSEDDPRMDTYQFDKMCGGLVDLALYGGHAPALETLGRIARACAKTFDRTRTPAGALDWDGRRPKGTLEWYTLAENLYRAHAATGDAFFAEFARVWHYDAYWARFAETSAPRGLPPVHAYSHANSFCSAALAARVTGDPKLLAIARNGFDYLAGTQAYATGGFGPLERLLAPEDGPLGRALGACGEHAEIGCGSWACFKLATHLTELTGEARYFDWAEKMFYNALGSALPVRPDGRTYYYADYRPSGAARRYYGSAWPCCAGTYLQGVSAYHELAYFQAEDSDVSVTLFVPSEVELDVRGVKVRLRQETEMPARAETTLRVSAARPIEFALRVRVPGWATGASASVAGAKVQPHREGGWLTVRRRWQDGDAVTVRFGRELKLAPVDAQRPSVCAVTYGPVVLAQEAAYKHPLRLDRADDDALHAKLRPTDDPLRFSVHEDAPQDLETGAFRPLWTFGEGEAYRAYVDLSAPRLYG